MPKVTPESEAVRKAADDNYENAAMWAEGGTSFDPADRGSSWAVQAMTIRDSSLLHELADAMERNDYNAARTVAFKMDTACRDLIPEAAYTLIMEDG